MVLMVHMVVDFTNIVKFVVYHKVDTVCYGLSEKATVVVITVRMQRYRRCHIYNHDLTEFSDHRN